MTHATRALQSLSGEGIKLWITYIFFFTKQGHGGPPRMSDESNAGATTETAQTWKTMHTKHTLSHPNKANMEWWLRRPNDIRGPWGPKVSWHLAGEEKPRKNLIQETCPDRGSNPGSLRDKRACYHLLHCGGLHKFRNFKGELKCCLSFFAYNDPRFCELFYTRLKI